MPRLMPCRAVMSMGRSQQPVRSPARSLSCLRHSSKSRSLSLKWFLNGKRSKRVMREQSGLWWMILSCTKAKFLFLTPPHSDRNYWNVHMALGTRASRKCWFAYAPRSIVQGLQNLDGSSSKVAWFVSGTKQNICTQEVCFSHSMFRQWCGVTSPWISWRGFLKLEVNQWC